MDLPDNKPASSSADGVDENVGIEDETLDGQSANTVTEQGSDQQASPLRSRPVNEPVDDADDESSSNASSTGSDFLLNEETLESIEDDKFGHRAYVDTLEEIIYRVNPPWHIGLYGTWGSGKSTIVNLLYRRIRAAQSDHNNYTEFREQSVESERVFENTLCVKFDAWKHAEGSVRTELLLDLNQSLGEELDQRFNQSGQSKDNLTSGSSKSRESDKKNNRRTLHGRSGGVLSSETLIEELYDVSEITSEESKPLSQAIRNLDSFHFVVLFTLAVLGSLLLIPTQVQAPLPESIGPLSLAFIHGLPWNLIASLAIGVLTLIAGAYLDTLFSDFQDTRRDVHKTLANPQKDWSGAYENLFESLIDETNARYRELQSRNDPEDLEKIIITIDDLDRCSSETTYEILIALKSFFRHEKCIYIIPCDEDALYKHLEAADDGDYLGDTRTQQNFLAKFFETELEIPTPSQSRLEDYFKNRVDQMNRSFSQRSLQVLYDAGLTTPRRITRALNRVATLEKLAEARGLLELPTESQSVTPDEAGDSVGITNNEAKRAFLTAIAVLQKDFPRLHAELETDPYLLDEIYTEIENDVSTNTRQGITRVLDQINIPPERRNELVTFLIDIRGVVKEIEDPEPYLRLSSTDRDRVKMFQARFDRGSHESIQKLIAEATENLDSDHQQSSPIGAEPSMTPPESSELREFANYVVRCVEEDKTQYRTLETAIRITGEFPEQERREIADALLVALKQGQVRALLSGIQFDSLEPILSSLPQERRTQFLDYYMRSILDDDGLSEKNFASLLEVPGELFDDIEVQDAFVDTIRNGRQQGTITSAEYAKILADVREYKPELYTPELVEVKL
ncbi:P-loop NTPase fold protein [Natrialbaceae archaeon A-CW2]